MATEFRTCTGCGETKPLTEFHRNKHCKGGRMCRCRACEAERKKAYYQERGGADHQRVQKALAKGAIMTKSEMVEWLKARRGQAASALFEVHDGPREVRDRCAGELRGIRFCLECLAGENTLHFARAVISQRYEWERTRQTPFWQASSKVMADVLCRVRERMLAQLLAREPEDVDQEELAD